MTIHEVGRLIIVRRLISEKASVHFFPSFPFGGILGLVEVPPAFYYPVWKGVAVAVSGPLVASILMFFIWTNTNDLTVAVISGFFRS